MSARAEVSAYASSPVLPDADANAVVAFHAPCERHMTIFQPLELVNLYLNGVITNSRYLELLWPTEMFGFSLYAPPPISEGIAGMPETSGLGIALDRDLIENDMLEVK